MLAIEVANAVRIGDLHREMTVVDTRDLQSDRNRVPQLNRNVGQLEAQLSRSLAPASAAGGWSALRSANSP
jgi:hypothetical protein